MELDQLKRIVEAALLASAQPLSIPQLLTLFGEQEMPSHDEVARALDELGRDAETRGVELKEVASGFRYQVRQEVNQWVSRLWTERQTRYSRALLETLSLIAYRQPITRGEIEQIRGVAVSTNIIKTLEEREWVRVVGYRDVPGKPELFGTTRNFLDYFNLKSLDELPPLAEIRDLHDFEPKLGLAAIANDGAPLPVDGDGSDSTVDEQIGGDASGNDPLAAAEATDEAHDEAVSDPSHFPDSNTPEIEAASDADPAVTEQSQT
jgi:segregation and condensation protein B